MRRFDHDTVENGHIYSSIKEEEVFIYSPCEQSLFSLFSLSGQETEKAYVP